MNSSRIVFAIPLIERGISTECETHRLGLGTEHLVKRRYFVRGHLQGFTELVVVGTDHDDAVATGLSTRKHSRSTDLMSST